MHKLTDKLITTTPERQNPMKLIKKYASSLTGFAKSYATSIKSMRSIPLTIAGMGCIAYSAFFLATGVGFLVLGIGLIVLEYLIADET